jgi:hypothetical protein
MEASRPARWMVLGPTTTLLGAALFTVSLFLPFYDRLVGPRKTEVRDSFLHALVGGERGLSGVGAWIFALSTVAIVVVTAVAVLRELPGWTRPLAVATLAWSLSWIGLLLSFSIGLHHPIGYWGMFAGVTIGLVGAWITRRTARELRMVDAAPLA